MKKRAEYVGLPTMLHRLSKQLAPQCSRVNLTLALIVLPLASFAIASVAIGKTQDVSTSSVAEELPLIQEDQLDRLLVNRQADLERRRGVLDRAIGNLGSNHPAVASMRSEREQLDEQLARWSAPIDELLSVEDRDLRVLVLQLAIRVDQLEAENRDQQYRIQKALLPQSVFHSSGSSNRGPSGGGPSSRSSRPPGPPPR